MIDEATRRRLRWPVSGALLAGLALAAFARSAGSPGPGEPRLGAHALVGQAQGLDAPVARTPPQDVAATGSSLVAFVAGYSNNDAPPRDNARNRWRPLGPPVAYRDYNGRFDIRGYVVEQASGRDGWQVRVDKPGEPDGELSLVAVEARDAGRLEDVAFAYPQPALRQRSGSVTTRGPALLVALWFGDSSELRHEVVPGPGFRLIGEYTKLPPASGVQAAVAVREVDRAGTWQASWYALPRQGAALWLLAFSRPDPGTSAGKR